MQKLISSTLTLFIAGLLFSTTLLHFNNTEAYLNGLTHHDQSSHRDYDSDGEKDSAHTKQLNITQTIKLVKFNDYGVVVKALSFVIVQEISFNYLAPFKLANYNPTIFRPPILA